MSAPEFCVALNTENASDPKSERLHSCLYRVAQEAINNCVKHSQSRKVFVTLTELQNSFYMTVRDSGYGFNTYAKHDGLGLVSMRERLHFVNGQLKISSTSATVRKCGCPFQAAIALLKVKRLSRLGEMMELRESTERDE